MTTKSESLYGQYCPLAMASELLCNRWTLLIIRELLHGSTTFNDISRGVPAMSRTLLSRRLKELEAAGTLSCRHSERRGLKATYRLTPAGNALASVVKSMATWGQEWIDVEPSVREIDVRFLMWDIRRNVRPLPTFPRRFTVRFFFPDAEEVLREHWLVIENEEVDLCYIDPGYEVDVEIEADLRTITMVWMGWEEFAKAEREKKLRIRGNRTYVQSAKEWLGLSVLAGVRKQPEELRVLRNPRLN